MAIYADVWILLLQEFDDSSIYEVDLLLHSHSKMLTELCSINKLNEI